LFAINILQRFYSTALEDCKYRESGHLANPCTISGATGEEKRRGLTIEGNPVVVSAFFVETGREL
jgi:hypothetical protein